MNGTAVSTTPAAQRLAAPLRASERPVVKAGFVIPAHHEHIYGVPCVHVADVVGMRVLREGDAWVITLDRRSDIAAPAMFRSVDRTEVEDVAIRLMADIHRWVTAS